MLNDTLCDICYMIQCVMCHMIQSLMCIMYSCDAYVLHIMCFSLFVVCLYACMIWYLYLINLGICIISWQSEDGNIMFTILPIECRSVYGCQCHISNVPVILTCVSVCLCMFQPIEALSWRNTHCSIQQYSTQQQHLQQHPYTGSHHLWGRHVEVSDKKHVTLIHNMSVFISLSIRYVICFALFQRFSQQFFKMQISMACHLTWSPQSPFYLVLCVCVFFLSIYQAGIYILPLSYSVSIYLAIYKFCFLLVFSYNFENMLNESCQANIIQLSKHFQ